MPLLNMQYYHNYIDYAPFTWESPQDHRPRWLKESTMKSEAKSKQKEMGVAHAADFSG